MFNVTFKFSDRKQIIAAIVFTCILKSVYLQHCSKLTLNKKHIGQRLVGFNIVTSKEESIGTCVKKCFQRTHCLSTNFDTVSKQCDLNNITAVEMTTAVVKSDTSILSDLSAWPKAMVGSCGDKPCNGHDLCLPAGNSFICRNSESKDCLDVMRQNISHTSGVYKVRSPYTGSVSSVYCDMTTDGGGWTVFQKRYNGNLDFYRTFKEYEDGFGDIRAEFWLGLSHIQEMMSQYITELRFDLTTADGTTAYETYQNFSLSPGPDYTLHIGQAAGTAGDSLTSNNGLKFSTKDKDVDTYSGGECAELYHGGWWYSYCDTYVNLNGDYVTPGTQSSHHSGWGGVVYYHFQNTKSLKTTRMMFRRK